MVLRLSLATHISHRQSRRKLSWVEFHVVVFNYQKLHLHYSKPILSDIKVVTRPFIPKQYRAAVPSSLPFVGNPTLEAGTSEIASYQRFIAHLANGPLPSAPPPRVTPRVRRESKQIAKYNYSLLLRVLLLLLLERPPAPCTIRFLFLASNG
jgi:hypothetical protein